MKEGETGKRIPAITEQITGSNSSRSIISSRKFHQANRASRPGFHAEGDHPRVSVMARVKTGMGAKGFPFFENATEEGEAPGFQGLRI